MGTIYFGPYHEEIDTYSHEGYAARVMPGGVETSTWGGECGITGHVGYRAKCDCGWSSPKVHPVPDPDPMESPEADEEWFTDHITPLVEQARRTAWPEWQRNVSGRAAVVVNHLASGRHRYAIDLLTAMREDLAARIRTAEDLAEAANEADAR